MHAPHLGDVITCSDNPKERYVPIFIRMDYITSILFYTALPLAAAAAAVFAGNVGDH